MDLPHAKEEMKIKKTKFLEEPRSTCFDHLPHEIALDIVSRLPITSIIQFSFVCRSFNSLYRNPLLPTLHLSRSLANETPYLIFHSDYPIRNQLHFLNTSDEKVRKIEVPFAVSMPEFSIIGSSNGLLCLVDTLFSESIYIYNPLTRHYKEIPKNFNCQDQVVVYGFGFHPVINDYKVIRITSSTNVLNHNLLMSFPTFRPRNRHMSQVQVYSLGRNTWEGKGFIPYVLVTWSSPGVLVNGRLHWVSRWAKYNGRFDRAIVSYDLADDSFSEITKPGLNSSSNWRCAICQLANINGSLSAVVPVPQGHGAMDIWTMKEYGVNESWVKEYTIGVYCPGFMISHELERSYRIWRDLFGRKSVQILCVMKNGEVMLEYRGGGLVSYNPCNGVFKELSFEGIPKMFQTTVLVGSLMSAAVSPL